MIIQFVDDSYERFRSLLRLALVHQDKDRPLQT